MSAYAPFELTINPASIPVPNKVYKVSYDFGDGSTHDQLLDITEGSPLQFPQTHQYFLTGSFVKNIEVNVNIYTFNTSSNLNYKVNLELKAPNMEQKKTEYPCGYLYFSGFEDPENKYSVITVYDWDTCLFSAGIYDTLPGAPSWLVDGHFTVLATGENVGVVIDATGGFASRLGNTYTISDIVNIAGYPVVASDTMKHVNGDSYCGNPTGEYIKIELSGLGGICVRSETNIFSELHLVGSRMFGPNDDILYYFESVEPSYILPVLVNWDEKPAPPVQITIPPEYRPFKLLAPFENEAVTSIDNGSHVYPREDGEGKYLPDPGNVNQIKIYDGNSVASRFFATIDNNWSNIANWKTDGGNASLYFPTTSVNVTVFEPIENVSSGTGYARNINFEEDTYLKTSTIVVQESAIFRSNSYNLGSISGNAYFLDNSYNQGFEPTVLSLLTQGADGSQIFTDSSSNNRILTYTGNPYITSYPVTPNTVVTDGLAFEVDAYGYSGDGSTWIDTVGGVVGTAQNSPTYVADSPSYFNFSGASQCFNFTRYNSAVNLNNNFTLETWVNVRANNEWGGIISLATGGYEDFGRGQGEQYSLNTTYGQYFRFDVNTGSYLNGIGYTLNDWTHIVTTFESGVVKTYKNGVLADTQTIASTANTITDAYLALGVNQYGGFEYLNGKIATARIYNKALSSYEALQNFNTTKQRFGKDGAPFGSFIYFDGSSKIHPVSAESDFSFNNQDFTIEGWICPTRDNGTSQVFYDTRLQPYWDGYYHPVLYLRSGLYLTFFDGYGDVIYGDYIPLNSWNHIAVSRRRNETKLFLNGIQTGGTANDNRNYVCGSERPLIGGAFDDYNFKGFMEYFKITKGTGKYTTNFIPPTAAPITDAYLTGMVSNSAFFRDNSINYGTLTNVVFSGIGCYNFGTVLNADVYYPTPRPLSGIVTGTLTYYGYSF